MSSSALIGAVDIGGTKIAVGAVSEDGAVVGRSECPTTPAAGFTAAMQRTAEMLRQASRQAGAAFCGIGVACPGPLDPLAGVVGDVGTLPGWRGGNIIAALSAEFGVPVAAENDADSAALAEADSGAGKGSSRFIYVTVSTGIGAGIILSGELYRGVDGAHPEIGHHVLDWSGPRCYCRARGCWEGLASGPAMTAWVREQNPEAGEWSAAEICERARAGHELARRAVEREGMYLGLGLANLITMFTPDTIVLGGGVMKSADLFMDRIQEVIREVCTQVPAEKTAIRLASLGPDTGLAGAARAWMHRYRR
ncbi:MAG TPA: ROK family protein [Verrucomicrobiae bacterium]|nr:ROK family protein [Verrucomicrobiae bacterium]